MNDTRVQEIFTAIRLHFTSDYDFFKYQGKAKAKNVHHSCMWLLRKVENERNIIYFFLANQIAYYANNGRFCGFIGEVANDDGLKVYENFMGRLKNLSFNLERNLDTFFGLYRIEDLRNFKLMVELYHTNKLSFLTILQIYKFIKVKDEWEAVDDPLCKEFLFLLKKTAPFLNFKKERFLLVFKKSFRNQLPF